MSIAQHSTEQAQPSSSKSQTSIKLHEPSYGEEEIAAVVEVMRSTNVTSGEKVRQFEAMFGKHAVLCNSGSSANLLAVAALCNPLTPNHMTPGDEVIVSALSWSTTIWPLVQHGLVPVIVDIDPETLNIDPEEILKAMSPRTRAIMPVHVYGNPCDMDAIMKIADDHELFVIEDCCEALGAPVGDRGIMATYSFYFSHHITTLEGGMVVARNVYDADMLRTLRAHGWTREQVQRQHHEGIDDKFLFVNMGYNLRASEANAAMGIVQYPKLAGFVESRREAARMYQAVFTSEIFYEDCFSLQKDSGGSSWFGFPIIVNDIAPFTAKELRAYFEANGIETRPMICGNIARQPAMHLFPHRTVGNLHYADHIMQNAFSIGCHQNITEDDVAWVATVLERFLDNA